MKNKSITRRFSAAILNKEKKRFIILSEWFSSFYAAEKWAAENLKKYVIIEEII